MASPLEHHVIAAQAHRVPRPFLSFAVRSDEALHAMQARAPYGCVHSVRTDFIDAASLSGLAAEGLARVELQDALDIDYGATTLAELAAAAPGVADQAGGIADALLLSGVLGDNPGDYRRCVATRIDYLACRGAGFHNDVSRHWSRCLFWVLALAVDDVEFVMPHAGVRLALAPGDLLVFDPAMAHGLCRPADQGQVVAASFEADVQRPQVFLTGELPLSDTQWAALGAPWLAVEEHERRAALDLRVAEFDERSGAIKRVRALRDSMKRSSCADDETEA